MARLKNGVVAFVVLGGLASLSVLGDEIGLIVFFWVLFGGIAGVVAMLASRSRLDSTSHKGDALLPRTRSLFPDEFEKPTAEVRQANSLDEDHGIAGKFVDVFDTANVYTPGADGRI